MNKNNENGYIFGLSSYGQHYLNNQDVLDVLIKSAEITSTDVVIEVGAGDGRITQAIADRASWVYAYEIDEKTKSKLTSLASQRKNVTVLWGNFLTLSIPDNATKIVASLPYQITEPFIEKMAKTSIDCICLIIGKTFADNVCTSDYSTKLSLLTNCYYFPALVCEISPESFSPPPRTKSAIVTLTRKEKADLADSTSLYLMRELFEQRDKKMYNALKEALIRLYSLRGVNLTQRQSKGLIAEVFQNPKVDLKGSIEQMKNEDLIRLFSSLASFAIQ